jgi:hypothetical protein
MSQDTLNLAARLDRLEAQNRRLKRVGAALALGLSLLALPSAAYFCDIVSGERLVLRDSSGRQRVMVDAYRTDAPALTFHSREGRTQASLGMDEKTGEFLVQVYDAKGSIKNSWRLGNEAAPAPAPAPAPQPKTPPTPASELPLSALNAVLPL